MVTERSNDRLGFEPTGIEGSCLIHLRPRRDARGLFVRIFSSEEFARHGLETDYCEWSLASSDSARTLRGLHYRPETHSESKLIRCVSGKVFDVILDVREHSQTAGQWVAHELTPDGPSLYVPPGVAHGYQVLSDGAEVLYWISAPYDSSLERGVRWDDPAFAIEWPLSEPILSPKDASRPDFNNGIIRRRQ